MSFIRKLLVTYSTLDILPILTTKSVLKSITLQRYFNETCIPWPYSWPLLIQDKINLITWRKIIIALCDCFFFFCAVVKLGQRKMVCLCCYLIFHEWHYPFPILLHDCFFNIIASVTKESFIPSNCVFSRIYFSYIICTTRN